METQVERVRRASRARRDRAKTELRQAILQAAGELLIEGGYRGFSLRQVAERIGYSPTTIYLHFRDKDELVFAVVDEAFDLFLRDLEAAARAESDPIAVLRALGRAYVRFGLTHPVQYRLMFMERPDFFDQARAGDSKPRGASFLVLQSAVQRAIEAGALRVQDAYAASIVYWATVHGVVALAITRPHLDQELIQRVTDLALDMTAHGLVVR